MDLEMKGNVYIVSGGDKGIGGAISFCLAREGAKVVVAHRSPLSEDFKKKMSSDYISVQGDLKEEAYCKKVVDEAVKKFGRLDGLVNNAGTNDGVDLDGGRQKFIASLEQNLIHYYVLTHYAIAHIKKSHGSIVNISSKTALTGQGKTSGYIASKAAALGLTREWAAALLADEVRVNAVVVAESMTPMYERWLESFQNPGEQLKKIIKNIPLGRRMTKPEEIADTVVFLLSKRSSHTTGQWIFPDGGYTHLDRSLTG